MYVYGRAIRFVNKNVQQSAVGLNRVYPSFFLSTQSSFKNRNFVDDIRESASGLPPSRSSGADDHVNDVKTSTTPSPLSPSLDKRVNDGDKTSYGSSPSDRTGDDNYDRDTPSYVADAVKQGVVKAMETGLNIGEMAKQTLDKVKKGVAGEEDKKYI